MVLFIVHGAELAGGYALYHVLRVYGEGRLAGAFERGFVELGGVAYLKRNVYRRLSLPGVACQEVEAVYVEVFL